MGQESLTRDELIAELTRLKETLGKVPSTQDMSEHGNYSVAPYYKYFDSWNAAIEAAGCEARPSHKSRSREELVDELQRIADECGDKPTQADIETHGVVSPQTYVNRFGSLNTALEEAGFEPRTMGTKIPRETLCEALRTLADELDRPPTASDMRTHGPYGEGTYVNRFGSWNAAREAAGIDDPPPTTYTDQQLIDTLQALADDLGHTPTTTEMNERGRYSARPYRDRFGSWDAALEAAGLDPEPQEPANKLDEAELIDELESLAEEFDRTPTTTDMQAHGAYSPGTYVSRFGSWTEALAAANIDT